MSIPDEKLNEIPQFFRDMCSDLSDEEKIEAYERVMEFMEIAWRIHVRRMSEEESLTENQSPILSSDKD